MGRVQSLFKLLLHTDFNVLTEKKMTVSKHFQTLIKSSEYYHDGFLLYGRNLFSLFALSKRYQQLAIMNGVLSIREVGKIINRHLADVPNDRDERSLI